MYRKNEVCWFIKASDEFGCLSNMYQKDLQNKLVVNGLEYRSSEALYQACRFPDHPEIQEKVREQKSPMAAKMVTKIWAIQENMSSLFVSIKGIAGNALPNNGFL